MGIAQYCLSERPDHMTNAYGGYDSRRDIISVIGFTPSYYTSIQDFTYHYYREGYQGK
jgi:hypothetical protein